MKTLFFGKLLALAAVLVLSSCGSGGGKAGPSEGQAAAEKDAAAGSQDTEKAAVQTLPAEAQDDLMRLLLVEGEASVTQDGSTKAYKDQPADQILKSGAAVITKPVSWADIQLGGGGRACLGTTSEVVITDTDGVMHFDLGKGRILFDTVQTDGDTVFEFATESAVLTFKQASGLISVNKEKRSSSIYLMEGKAKVTGIRPDGRLTAEKELAKGMRLIFAPTNEEDAIPADADPIKEKNLPWNFWHSMMYHEDMLSRIVADKLLDVDAMIEAVNAEAEENKDPALTAWFADRREALQEAVMPEKAEEMAAEEEPSRLDAFLERCEKGVTMDVELIKDGETLSMPYAVSGKNRCIDVTDIQANEAGRNGSSLENASGDKYSSIEIIRNEDGVFSRINGTVLDASNMNDILLGDAYLESMALNGSDPADSDPEEDERIMKEYTDLITDQLKQYSFLDYDAQNGDLVTGNYMETKEYNGKKYHAENKWLYTYLFEGDTLRYVLCKNFPEPGKTDSVEKVFVIKDIQEGADGSLFDTSS